MDVGLAFNNPSLLIVGDCNNKANNKMSYVWAPSGNRLITRQPEINDFATPLFNPLCSEDPDIFYAQVVEG